MYEFFILTTFQGSRGKSSKHHHYSGTFHYWFTYDVLNLILVFHMTWGEE
jgi:hypothetical protein